MSKKTQGRSPDFLITLIIFYCFTFMTILISVMMTVIFTKIL